MISRLNMLWISTLMLTLTMALAPAPTSAAKPQAVPSDKAAKADSTDDARVKELQERFKQRYDQVRAQKKQGVIGETFEGYLDFVTDKKPEDSEKLVEQENEDRRELYKLIAKKEGTTPDKVATVNAKRNFSKASAGEFLKAANGKWTKKS